MSPKPELERDEAAEPDASEGVALTMAELVQAGDAEGLLALAKAHRAGTDGVEKDLAKALACYEAAAKLGSAAGEYSAALFYLNGGVVERDPKEAAQRFRAAADKGYTPAKVYVANLYELGIHYKADPAKADVWYRNAARSSGIDAEPGTPEYRRAMAELGCVRHCLEIVRDPAASAADKDTFAKKAKAFGYRPGGERASMTPEPADARASSPGAARASVASAPDAAPENAATTSAAPAKAPATKHDDDKPPPRSIRDRWGVDFGDGFGAFFLAAVFFGAAFAGAHALTIAVEPMAQAGRALPVVGTRVELILPILVGVVGALPTLLVYRLPTFLRALVVGALVGVAGEVLWNSGRVLVEPHFLQVSAFAAAGMLAALLVLGVFGGTRTGWKARHLRKLAVGMPLRVKDNLKR